HLPELKAALSELFRITRPGGQVLLVDFHPHENAAFQARMADERPGIDPAALQDELRDAGFGSIRHHDIGQPNLPDHELAPLPRLYAITAVRSAASKILTNKKPGNRTKGNHE